MRIGRSIATITREFMVAATKLHGSWVPIAARVGPRMFISKDRSGWIHIHLRGHSFKARLIMMRDCHLVSLVRVRVHASVFRHHTHSDYRAED